MSNFIAPKSDQLNSDDLIGGPRTITITRVSANEGNGEQPINVFFDGDDGKPFRPCKSMRRVMVNVWGANASEYVGRSMTIYRDPSVTWGGMAVGGIRISHMTHIDAPVTMALTATAKARKPYTVQPLTIAPPIDMRAQAEKWADGKVALYGSLPSEVELNAAVAKAAKGMAALADFPDLAERVTDAERAARLSFMSNRADADHGDAFADAERADA